jgi:hypothetical protein
MITIMGALFSSKRVAATHEVTAASGTVYVLKKTANLSATATTADVKMEQDASHSTVPLRSAYAIHKQWENYNCLSICFHPFTLKDRDLLTVGQGYAIEDSHRYSKGLATSWSPNVIVSVTLEEPSSDDDIRPRINGFVAGHVTISGVWVRKSGETISSSERAPLEGFSLVQTAPSEVQLAWKGERKDGMLIWDLHAKVVLTTPEHGSVRWVADAKRNRCMSCTDSFGPLKRKHHCRTCGEIFCGSCSAGSDSKGRRICNRCGEL